MPDDQRLPTNVALPKSLVAEARALKIDISAACEAGLRCDVGLLFIGF